MRVLIAEDEVRLAENLAADLVAAGFAVDISGDGEDVAYRGAVEPYDVVVLDLGLPSIDGLNILKQWRIDGVKVPVLILTARDTWSERIKGIDAGADDYVCKPFHTGEVVARVRALIRRSKGIATSVISVGHLNLDTTTGIVTNDGEVIKLTAFELKVLSYFMHNKNRSVSRTELIEHVYAQDFDRDSNTIEVFVRRLRKKLGADLIQTQRGLGYILNDPNAPTAQYNAID